MNNKRNRRIAMIIAVLMLTMAFSTTGFAAWMGKTIEAQYRNVTIFVNGEYKQAKTEAGVVVEPFIIDGTTYVPLRGISQMLGYQVSFNPATYRIDIQGGGTDVAAQWEILMLKAQIEELEDKLAEKEASVMDIDDLESDLKSDYRKIDRLVDIEDIDLRGDEKDVEVRIYVNLRYQSDLDNWDDLMDDGEVKNFLQDVVDDILAQYKDADVEGYIEDKYDKSKLVEFTIDSRGNIKLGSVSSMTLPKLEDALYYEFRDYNGIKDFVVSGTTSRIKVDVLADSKIWEEDLTATLRRRTTNEIIAFIEEDFPSASITGRVLSFDKDELMYEFSN
jgi:hypothetical protein